MAIATLFYPEIDLSGAVPEGQQNIVCLKNQNVLSDELEFTKC